MLEMWKKLSQKAKMVTVGVAVLVVIVAALFIYEETKSSTPSNTQSAQSLAVQGIAAFKSGDYSFAQQLFTEELGSAGTSTNAKALAYYNLGTVLVAQKNVTGGIGDFQSATSDDPQFALAWLSLGIAQGEEKNDTAALAAYNTLLKIDATNSSGLFNSGIIMYNQGNTTAGVARIKKAIQLKPTLVSSLPSNIKLS